MKLLVLGGTKFLGRAAVEAALARGHEVTLFNRGETSPELFPEAEKLRGDRGQDLSALEGRTWDAVIDPSGYVPHVVRSAAEALADSTGHYLFISSVSVYGDFSEPRNEDSPLEELADDKPVDRLLDDYSNYGALKALCERAVEETIPDRHAVVRPGLIVGPHDPTGRFTYWPHRIARGGEVLVPGPPEQTVQFVDVRDLAGWLIDLSERKTGGRFNAINEGVSWQTLAETCRDVAGSDADFTYVDGDYPARARGGRVDGASALAPGPGGGRHAQDRRLARTRGGPHIPPAHGDGPRHARRGRDDGQRRNGSRARGGDPGRVEGSVASPDVEGYDFVHQETVRFRDVDAMGHVNNAVFLTYIEEARIAYLLRFGAEVTQMILARAEIDFRAPLRDGDELEIGVRPAGVGTKSFELEYEVRSADALAAEAKTVIVSFDYESGQSVDVPRAWREALAA